MGHLSINTYKMWVELFIAYCHLKIPISDIENITTDLFEEKSAKSERSPNTIAR